MGCKNERTHKKENMALYKKYLLFRTTIKIKLGFKEYKRLTNTKTR